MVKNIMTNILVTGSKGFIGRNLLKRLDFERFNILEFRREDSLELLEKLVVQSDFIVHLAGEVRMERSYKTFYESNTLLTYEIVHILKSYNKNVPILMTSSIHAEFSRNKYGETKRKSELILEKYFRKSNVEGFIYRLPHVFGEGCKPNYNSVVSTWIYNSVNDLEINCFDRSIQMQYVYVQDLVDEFVSIIKGKQKCSSLYITPRKIYPTTLGEVVDMIDEFKECIENQNFNSKDSELKQKFRKVYLYYYKKAPSKKIIFKNKT